MRYRGLWLGVVACAPESPLPPPVADAGEDRWAEVGEILTLEAGSSAGGALAWFVDGEPVGEGSPIVVSFETPGRRTLVVQVTNEAGVSQTDGATLTVVPRPAATPPSASAPMVEVSGEVWAVWPEADALVAGAGDGPLTVLPVCAGPRSLVFAEGSLVVACERGEELVWVDPTTRSVTARVALPRGSRPFGVAYDAGTSTVVATLPGAEGVARVRPSGVMSRVWVGPDPRAIAVLPDGRWVATRFRASGGTSQVYFEDQTADLAWDPGPDSDTNTRGVPHLVEQIAVSPDGAVAWLPGLQANIARGEHRDGLPLTFETAMRAHLSVLDLNAGIEQADRRKIFDDQGRALPVAVTPRGDLLWVGFPGTGAALAVDAFDGSIRNSILGIGRGLIGLVVSPDGDTLYAWTWLERKIVALDLRQDPPRVRWEASLQTADPVPPEILGGLRLFWEAGDPRMARSGYVACVHCHPDGDQDGLTWDFTDRGEGLRNTISLWGRAGLGMGPLHWTGNFDEVQDFENDIRGGQGGSGLLPDGLFHPTADPLGAPKAGLNADLDALAAYVASLTTTPPSGHAQPEDALFQQKCAACHPAPRYTVSDLADPVRYDVGTFGPGSGGRRGGPWDGLDVPTLLGAASTGPWLHDGSAPTLEAAIRRHVPELTEEEVALSADFVRSL